MSGWANQFTTFSSLNNSTSSRANSSFNKSFKFKQKEPPSRYTPLNQMPLSAHPSGSKTNFTAPFKTGNNGAAKNTPKKNFNFRAEKVQAPADDWGDDDDFADLDLDNDDFNTAMDAFDNSSPPMEDKNKNEPKISDEELQEMTMALMNDDDDDWDLDDDNVPAPMDSAKARLNQTTAVFAGPNMDDFYDDGPKPEEIIKNLKDENKKMEKELSEIRPKVIARDQERFELRSELDAKAKELEKEMRLRRNLELNMKRELERVERQAIEKEKELKKLKVELSKEKSRAAKVAMTQLPGDGSCTTQQQQPDISATAPPGGVKKRKLSSSSDSVNESTPQKVIEIKSEFRPFERIDMPDFLREQYCMLGGVLGESGTSLTADQLKQKKRFDIHDIIDETYYEDQLSELRIF